jgi:hypothetical protein
MLLLAAMPAYGQVDIDVSTGIGHSANSFFKAL